MVQLVDTNVQSFEICVGNVTVNAENVDSYNTTIDVSSGFVSGYVSQMIINGTSFNVPFQCPIEGLPCFNFFFETECPPTTTEVYRSCECEEGMVSMELEYTGSEDVSITFTQKPRRRGAVYTTVSARNGDVISVEAGIYGPFKRKTGVIIVDSTGNTLCSGKIPRCSLDTVGSTVKGCSDLTVTSWTSGDGALCDALAVTLADDSTSYENVLANKKESLSDVWIAFREMDPFIRYSLIGVMVSAAFCFVFFGYCICTGDQSTETKLTNAVDNGNTSKMDPIQKEENPKQTEMVNLV